MLSHRFAGEGLRFPRRSQPGPHLPAAHSPSYALVFPLLCLKRKGQPPRLTASMCVDLFSLEQMAHTLDFMEGGAEECRLVGTRCLGRPSLAGNDSRSIVQPDRAGAAQEHSARPRGVSSVAPGQYKLQWKQMVSTADVLWPQTGLCLNLPLISLPPSFQTPIKKRYKTVACWRRSSGCMLVAWRLPVKLSLQTSFRDLLVTSVATTLVFISCLDDRSNCFHLAFPPLPFPVLSTEPVY